MIILILKSPSSGGRTLNAYTTLEAASRMVVNAN